MATTLAFGCSHAPYTHPDAVDFLADLRRQFKPDHVYHLGDEIDAHRWSRHEPEADAMGAADELTAARKQLRPLYKLFPDVKVCTSNHGSRHLAAANRAGLPSDWLRSVADVLCAPRGWRWADYWIDDDGVRYEHGDRYSGQNGHVKAAMTNRCSTVIAHIHSYAGVAWRSNGSGPDIFAVNAGCLVDPQSFGMRYAKRYSAAPTLGACVILEGTPVWVPLI